MSHWTADAGAVHCIGRTQTGKTTTAREIHAENNRLSIWLNSQGTDRVPNVAGKRVRSLDGLRSGLQDDVWKYNWLSNDRVADLQALKEWAWDVAERTNREFRMQIVVDEAHHVAPQSQKDTLPGRDDLRQIAKEGTKRNIKLCSITQDPVALDKQTLRQREYLCVFGLTAEQSNYLEDYGVDVDLVREQPEYAGVVFHANGSVVADGVKARAKFA